MDVLWKIKMNVYSIQSILCRTTEDWVKLKIRFDIINEDLSPKRCLKCGCSEFIEEIIEHGGIYGVIEKSALCKECGYLGGSFVRNEWVP